MKHSLIIGTFSAALLTFGSTHSWSQEQSGIDCSTAMQDISHLQHEKKSTDERQVKGVLSIMPIGLAINAASSAGGEDHNKEMEINAYNEKLVERIKEIRKTCNIP